MKLIDFTSSFLLNEHRRAMPVTRRVVLRRGFVARRVDAIDDALKARVEESPNRPS